MVRPEQGQGYLDLTGRIDVLLDAFPFCGQTTTCEYLWMGVPVVTWCGPWTQCRPSASILTTIGLADLVASSREEYVRIAADLARSPERMRELRRSLRERMRARL